jgi:hypothetical protein
MSWACASSLTGASSTTCDYSPHRTDIDCFARDLEAGGGACATITRRLCTIIEFFRYAVEQQQLLNRSLAVHVRRLQADDESYATGSEKLHALRPVCSLRLHRARMSTAARIKTICARSSLIARPW